MKQLDHTDRIHLNDAEGWFGLGDLESARNELEKLSPEFRADPYVLLMRCQIHQDEENWAAVIALAETLVQQLPKTANGWIYRSQALHKLNRTQEAYDFLLPAFGMFPKNHVIPYDLACYACQLGKSEEALKLFDHAIELGSKEHDLPLDAAIRLSALKDPDLEQLWSQMEAILKDYAK